MGNIYEADMDWNDANHVPLTPISLLRRTASVHPDRTAVIYGGLRRSWSEIFDRCVRLASALGKMGIARGDTVAFMAPNIPEFLEAHFAVPMSGAVLNALNTRLDAGSLSYMLEHGEARILIADREYAPVLRDALREMKNPPEVIEIIDPSLPAGESLGGMDYESFLATGDPDAAYMMPPGEGQAISLNYTSGTTGLPKGVVYSHRGAYLNALGNAVTWPLPHYPVYLWTLPMFHCNGWCFPWTITAMAGTHVCLRRIDADSIYKAIADNRVTHLCGAPVVMGMMIEAAEQYRGSFSHTVSMMTAAAAPPATVMAAMAEIGIRVTHVYGLTEVYGPAAICSWHPEWDSLPPDEQARRRACQGVPYEVQEDMMVCDPANMQPVPRDGETIGEIMMRGNIMMKGYLKDADATKHAFEGGWFHTGDLAVMHQNGYVEIKDRSKDIIISGGENISSIEIENTLYQHPDVQTAAVVAMKDPKWGETPCAFIELKKGRRVSERDFIDFCRTRLAHYKCPRKIILTDIPRTVTGKIQKYELRQRAETLV